MGDKRPRWHRSDAERFKRWLIQEVECIDALARAATSRIADADREALGGLLSTCDAQQFRYLLGKLEEILANLEVCHGQIREALG